MPESIMIMLAIITFACAVETFSGFAGAMVAITLGAHFWPIELLVSVWVALDLLMNSYIALRHRGHVVWGLLFKQVIPFMCLGLLLGLWLFPYLEGFSLKGMLGGLIIVFAGSRLIRVFRPNQASSLPFSRWQAGFWQFWAGSCHAIYATGGPLIVYSLSRSHLAKSVFRATLCALWALMNASLISAFALNGRLDAATLEITACLLPALVLGILLGEWMHGRVNEKQFQVSILGLLLVAGATLII